MDTIILDNSEIETVIIKISEFPESSRKWADITDKPAVIAAGATIQEALEQIGLENVNAEITSLQATKVDKVAGLGLSQENFTTTLKNKLDSITAIFTTALKTAYDGAVTWISTNGTNILNHLSSTSNPHSVTKTQVGLGSVDDTPDTAKPVSTAQQTALNLKINSSLIGVNNGVASLNSSGKVPLTQISLTTTDVPEGTNKYNATHTGEVTGSTALTITNKAVTLAKIQDIPANSILGNDLAVAGVPKSLTPVGLTLSGDKVYNGRTSVFSGGYNGNTLNNPEGCQYMSWNSITGAIRIKVPTGAIYTFTIKGTLSVFGSNATTFIISSHNAPNLFTTAIFIGGISYPVRWYTDGTNKYIYIGELSSTWSNLNICIDNVLSAADTINTYSSGWVISVETAFIGTLNTTRLASQTLPNSNLNQIVSDYVAASGVDTPLTNAMSPLQMFQNLQKQNDNRYTKAQSDGRYFPSTVYTNAGTGVLLKTDIATNININVIVKLIGNGASGSNPIDITIQLLQNAAGVISRTNAISLGYSFPIYAFSLSGFLHIWFNSAVSSSIGVNLFSSSGFNTPFNYYSFLATDEVKPTTGVTNEVLITPKKALLNDGSASNLILGDGTYQALSTINNYRTITAVASSRALALTDNGSYLRVTANSTITVPLNSVIAFPIGARIRITALATFTATMSATVGVTVNGLANIVGFGSKDLIKVGTNEWDLI